MDVLKVIEPSVKLLVPKNDIQHVARCARVCYGKEQGDDIKLYEALLNNKHYSMFRHETHYVILNKEKINTALSIAENYLKLNKEKIVGIDIKSDDNNIYIVVNGQWIIEHEDTWNYFNEFEVTRETFANTQVGFNMLRYTFEIITQISTSRELNRVSPNNISERSTRYVYEDGSICRPHWISKEEAYLINDGNIDTIKEKNITLSCYANMQIWLFITYKSFINNKLNKQDARGILSLDTATKCIYTYSVDEWRHIIDLRYKGITGKPHPNAYIIGEMLYNKFKELGYNF